MKENDNNEMDTIEESKRVAPLSPTAVLGYEEPKLVIKKGGKLKRILATAALALVAIGLGAPYISNLIPKTSMPTPTPTPVEIVEEYEQEEEKQTPTPTPKITPIPEESTKPNRPSSGGNSDKDDEHGVDNNPIITPDPTPGETPAPEINLKPGDRFVQENEGGSRETLVDQNGNVIVEEKGNGNNLPNNDINVLDPNQGTGSGTLENDNPNLTEEAGNEGLKETVEDDISSGKFDDLFSALNSPDEVDIDAYSVQAEEPVAKVAQPQINQEETPTIYTQDQLDQIIYDVLNGSGPTM